MPAFSLDIADTMWRIGAPGLELTGYRRDVTRRRSGVTHRTSIADLVTGYAVDR